MLKKTTNSFQTFFETILVAKYFGLTLASSNFSHMPNFVYNWIDKIVVTTLVTFLILNLIKPKQCNKIGRFQQSPSFGIRRSAFSKRRILFHLVGSDWNLPCIFILFSTTWTHRVNKTLSSVAIKLIFSFNSCPKHVANRFYRILHVLSL